METSDFLKRILEGGLPLQKLSVIMSSPIKPTPSFLRSCMCTQILSQGDCKLTEIAKIARLNGL